MRGENRYFVARRRRDSNDVFVVRGADHPALYSSELRLACLPRDMAVAEIETASEIDTATKVDTATEVDTATTEEKEWYVEVKSIEVKTNVVEEIEEIVRREDANRFNTELVTGKKMAMEGENGNKRRKSHIVCFNNNDDNDNDENEFVRTKSIERELKFTSSNFHWIAGTAPEDLCRVTEQTDVAPGSNISSSGSDIFMSCYTTRMRCTFKARYNQPPKGCIVIAKISRIHDVSKVSNNDTSYGGGSGSCGSITLLKKSPTGKPRPSYYDVRIEKILVDEPERAVTPGQVSYY